MSPSRAGSSRSSSWRIFSSARLGLWPFPFSSEIFLYRLVFYFHSVLCLLGCFRLEGKTKFNFCCRQKKIGNIKAKNWIKSFCKEICTFAQRLASDIFSSCLLIKKTPDNKNLGKVSSKFAIFWHEYCQYVLSARFQLGNWSAPARLGSEPS